MPITRRRHLITETEQVARALDDAARRWPEERGNRAKLLLHLLEEGHLAVVRQRENTMRERREAVARTSGALTGAYGEGTSTSRARAGPRDRARRQRPYRSPGRDRLHHERAGVLLLGCPSSSRET